MKSSSIIPFDPLKIANKATKLNEQAAKESISDKIEKTNNEESLGFDSKISKHQHLLWAGGDKVDMKIPVDGWNINHWICYFSIQFRRIFGHMYTGNKKLDNKSFSHLLLMAREELQMNNQEIVDYLNWASLNKMNIFKLRGQIYHSFNLINDLKEYYNIHLFSKIVADKNLTIPARDLPVNPSDLRVAIHQICYRNSKNEFIDFDNRLLLQFGTVIMMQYLLIQEQIDRDTASKLILNKIDQIIREDVKKNGVNVSQRFERMIRSTISWEPYPWPTIGDWRKSLKAAIDFFKLRERKWWREKPTIKRQFSPCLKKLNSRKKDFSSKVKENG